MATLECPADWCFNTGSVTGRGVGSWPDDDAFERRGKARRRPVFRCQRCGEIFVARVGIFGVSTYKLSPEVQVEMDLMWREALSRVEMANAGLGPYARGAQQVAAMERHKRRDEQRRARLAEQAAASGRTIACPYCEKYLKDERGLARHIADKHPEAAGDEPAR